MFLTFLFLFGICIFGLVIPGLMISSYDGTTSFMGLMWALIFWCLFFAHAIEEEKAVQNTVVTIEVS